MPTARIRSHESTHAYWQYDGEPVLLLGGSREDNLFQIPDLESHLDDLVAVGGNYVRCTMSSRDEGDVWPYERVEDDTGTDAFGRDGPGATYDLDGWNEEYWDRFDRFLDATRERDVLVRLSTPGDGQWVAVRPRS